MPDPQSADTDVMVVFCTTGDPEIAGRIAQELVERRQAACVNVVPRVLSYYRWKGEVVKGDEEQLLVIKTRRALLGRLDATIRELHSYELPEMIALPLAGGDPEYLAWVRECVPV